MNPKWFHSIISPVSLRKEHQTGETSQSEIIPSQYMRRPIVLLREPSMFKSSREQRHTGYDAERAD